MDYLDDFFGYLTNVDGPKLFRIFWFFFIFEFFRFFLVDFTTVLLWRLTATFRRQRLLEARNALLAENPLVSIIVPGKNEGKHIFKLANSLKEQTYKNFEFIVVDDGSDDDTAVICGSLIKNGLITMFLSNKVRGGKASAANLALRYTKGKYIVHMDADCSFDVDAVENILVPFYYDKKIGAVGGDVQVRNFRESLCATLQSLEYTDTISVGRVSQSQLGIYRIISGAFGAFRKEALDAVGGWDIGPGLDGDITVKIRKLGFHIHFEPTAVCQTSVPVTFKALIKQRLRWDKSLVRFRLRKHNDVYVPNSAFRLSTFISFIEDIFYNLILNFKWYFYILDMLGNFASQVVFIVPMNYLLYTTTYYFKFIVFSLFRDRKNVRAHYYMLYIPLMPIYFGYYIRLIRTYAYLQEILFRASYDDKWNPAKSSNQAKALKI